MIYIIIIVIICLVIFLANSLGECIYPKKICPRCKRKTLTIYKIEDENKNIIRLCMRCRIMISKLKPFFEEIKKNLINSKD